MATSTASAVRLNEFIRRFEPGVPEVARAITEEIWTEIPSYASLDSQARSDVEEAASRNVTAFVRALREGRELPKREIESLAKVGEQRAQQGVPLEDVLHAFRTVGRVLWDHLSKQLHADSAPPMGIVIELAGTLMRFTDQISSAVARHYSVAQRSIVRQQEAARREFLHDLLLGTYRSPDEMVSLARGFGYDLARPHIALVATATTSDPAREELELTRALDRLGDRVEGLGQPMVDRRGGQSIGLLGINSSEASLPGKLAGMLIDELGEGWQLGVGGAYAGVEGCRKSYLEAREAIEIGSVIDPTARTYMFDDLLLYRFLRADLGLAERFVHDVLGPIIEHDERRKSELIKTLDAYFATDGSAKEAGKRLYAHPHTVTYRLKQIEKLSGRSLRDPEDKLHLHLAVKALRLRRGNREDASASPSSATA